MADTKISALTSSAAVATQRLPVAISPFGAGDNRYITVQSVDDYLAQTTQTLTNKTLTGPILTSAVLGTPSSGVLTNLTGYLVSNLTGLGTGVATALAVNVGSAGAFVTFNGALGTPSSGVATNLTGTAASLTAGTASAVAVGGITGLAANVATFLATPTSANLIAAMTDETGTGANVFATSPTLVTPLLGTPTSGVLTNATGYTVTNLVTTATNDSAASTKLGERITGTAAQGSVSIAASATVYNITSVALTAGDWEVYGEVCYTPVNTTVVTALIATIYTANNGLGTISTENRSELGFTYTSIGNSTGVKVGPTRISLAGSATYYLNAYATFSVSTMTAGGWLAARRVR